MSRLLLLLLLLPLSVAAHSLSESFSSWQWFEGTLTLHFTIEESEATRIAPDERGSGLPERLNDYVGETIHLDGGDCVAQDSGRVLPAQRGWLRIERRWDCSTVPTRLTIGAFLGLAAEHVHYASFEADGDVRQKVLTAEGMDWQLDVRTAERHSTSRLPPFFVSGARHIGAGADHLVFLLALLLVFQRTREIVFAITGFTLGHTLALAAVALGAVVVPGAAVESLIGLTICLVCIEYLRLQECNATASNVALLGIIISFAVLKLFIPMELTWGVLAGLALASLSYLELSRLAPGPAIWPYAITGFFGLIHGAGFATDFVASEVVRENILLAVFAFNLGVEAGQLIFVAASVAVFRLLALQRLKLLSDTLIAALFGVGVYWFISRGFLAAA